MQSVSLVSQFVLLLICVAITGGAIAAKGDAKPAGLVKHEQHRSIFASGNSVAGRQSNNLPESTILQQHDDLLPTQNRTQAMVLESENGHLPGTEEQVLKSKGYLKKSK